ncbi:sortase [Streptomyces yaizuensis]|uniref:Sortase n=1 Tax=Streptomyces yaizuensis TaxID=2989713 RepID=A0ABQ5P760_9ACTN|nr:sortase [Streptomyces sp. YSPA8]GLF98076.1 sortase [Streptomyces sp. YSPA8]
MTHTPDNHGTDEAPGVNTSAPRTTPRIRLRTLLAAGAVLTAAAVTATLAVGGDDATGTPPTRPAQPAATATTPGPPAAQPAATAEPSAPQETPSDPLALAAPTEGVPSEPDETGTAATTADRALSTWASSNPAAQGNHAVGGDTAPGPGGTVNEVLRIPALGSDWAQPIYDGVTDKQLRAGIGHFRDTEEPGAIGNYALAGHRSGVADPAFRGVDKIKPGSAISVTTANRITYTYTVTRVHTVEPHDVSVLAQVPGKPDATPTKAKLTIVTCWPANGSSKRVIVEADLTSSQGGT